MATEITDGVTIVEPLMVLGWQQTHAVRTVLHEVLASPYPDVTLRQSASPTGTLELLCADEPAALAVAALHTAGAVLTLTDDDLESSPVTYVVSGPVNRNLDAATRRRWIVSAPWRAVAP